MDFYFYKLQWYNECSEKIINSQGIVIGEDYADAMRHLSHTYGESYIETIELLEPTNEEYCLEITNDKIMDALRNNEVL